MAIYRLEVKSISRRDGRSATAAAAYRSAERIEDERTGETHDYTRRQGVAHTEMILPDHAPQDFRDRSSFWNAAEAAERRKDSKVARDIIAALPHELDDQQRRETAQAMARHLVDRYGVGVDLAIHAPDRQADQRNWHAHMLISTREINPDGFGAKTRQLDVKQTSSAEITHMRERWAVLQNRSLEQAGRDERVNHRSNEDRGLDRIPEPKLGPVATDMERAGRRSKAGDDLRRVRSENAALQAALAQRKVIDLEIEREKRRLEQAEQKQEQQEAERFSVAASLEQKFGQQRFDLSRRAEDLQGDLDRQNGLQRFWFNLTGRNDRKRFELEQVQADLKAVQREQSEARKMLEAQERSRTLAQQTQQRAQEATRPAEKEATDRRRAALDIDFAEAQDTSEQENKTQKDIEFEKYRERFNQGIAQRSQSRGRDMG